MSMPTHTPAQAPFVLPTPALTKAVEAEWNGAKRFNAATMPYTQLAFTTIDRIAPAKADVVEALMVYADTDTLCYRSHGEDEAGGASSLFEQDDENAPDISLSQLQAEQWDPVLAWAGSRFDAIWQTTSGIMPVEQSPALLDAMSRYLNSLDAWKLSAFCVLASGLSSLVLALAVVEGHLDARAAFMLSRLEEEAQAARWGRDEEADKRAEKMQQEILQAEEFLRLLGSA
jgi:chaperone required for assembly of F1-ATPase